MEYETVQSELFRRLAGAVSAVEALHALIEQDRDDAQIHAKIVASLLNKSVEPDGAKSVLDEILAHHARLSQELGRDVDLRVAAMEYAVTHPEVVSEPVVVDQQVFALSQRLAAVDELTGLFNRRFLDLYLAKELNRARRYSEEFSILFMDLDDFKSINDSYGHDVGDQVLSGLAGEVLGLLRREDFAARYGGEEFVVVLPHTETDGAERFADRLADRLRAIEFPSGVRVTYSGGIATYPLHGSSPRELLHNADAALYQAKLNGKNHARVAQSDKRSSPRHIADLRALCYLDDRELGEVRLHDISRAGVSVESDRLLAPGQTIRFRIQPPDADDRVDVFAQVVWSTKVDEVEYRFGGRWASTDDEVLRSLVEQVAGQ